MASAARARATEDFAESASATIAVTARTTGAKGVIAVGACTAEDLPSGASSTAANETEALRSFPEGVHAIDVGRRVSTAV